MKKWLNKIDRLAQDSLDRSKYLRLDKNERKAKGIKKNTIENNIKHQDYKETLFNSKQMYHNMKTIRSDKHEIASYELNKVSLSCFDDKRYILNDGIQTYAYGHYKI